MENKTIFALVFTSKDEFGQQSNDLVCFWFQKPTADELVCKIYGKTIEYCSLKQMNEIANILSGNGLFHRVLQLKEGEFVVN